MQRSMWSKMHTRCEVACNKPLPCGHEKVFPCFKRPGRFEWCNSDCNKVLACGHTCSKKCKDRCQCDTTIEVELTCKHRVRVLCREKLSPPLCTEKCSKDLDCGHSCPRLCFENCKFYQCETLVDKVLPCGHTKRIPCHVDTNIVICEELCQKTYEKGHPCQQRCHFGLLCGDCKEVVNTTIPECKHAIKTFCNVDPATLVCKMPCKRERERESLWSPLSGHLRKEMRSSTMHEACSQNIALQSYNNYSLSQKSRNLQM